nr:MFS transporter [Clostridia bacterium]
MTKNKIIKTAALVAANGLVYGFNALYYCFIQIYLEQYHDPVNAGILLAIGPLVSIFAPLFWGVRADKAKYKNTILLITVIGSALFYTALMFNHSFWYQFAILTVLMFFMSPFGGLIDIITLEYTSESGVAYGPIRLTGTFVFGALPMVLTIFTETNINIIFPCYLILAAVCTAALILMPKVEGHADESEKISMMPVFRDYRLMVIFIMTAVSQFTWAYYLNFFPTYITGDLGLPQTVWGVNVFVTVLGEVPFFLLFTKIFNRFGIKKVLFVSLLLSVLRYLGLATATNTPIILAVGLVTGVSVTVFTYCASVYINDNIAPEMKATAQTLMYALCNGIPKVLAGVFGGMMTKSMGVPVSMFICTGMSVLSVILYMAVFAKDKSPLINAKK